MEYSKRQVNISVYQIAFILLICRCQSFMISIKLRDSLTITNSNIFISIAISLLTAFIIYIPAFLLLKKFKYINIITISQKIFPVFGKIIAVIFSLYFLLMAIAHVTSTNFFMLSYIYVDASPFFIFGIIVVVFYALCLGIESIFRSGTIIFILFFILNGVVLFLLTPTYNTHYFGPFIFSELTSITQKSFNLTFCAELVAFLLLAEYTKQKSVLTFSIFQIVLFFMEVLLMLCITLAMGRYANTNTFPLYTISSMVEIPILERLESFYIVLDTMLSFIKTSIYIFLSKRCLQHVTGNKFNITINACLSIICLIFATWMAYNVVFIKNILSFVNSPILICCLIIVLPIILLILDSLKKKNHFKQKQINQITKKVDVNCDSF